jgi:adenylate kinase family enzyme
MFGKIASMIYGPAKKMQRRIHRFGASGSGTTIFGKPLSNSLGINHFDTDNYIWVKTAIPYTEKRELSQRVENAAE